MTDITAPYNFVPLSGTVCTIDDLGIPKHQEQGVPNANQDDPFEGALSGAVKITLSVEGALLVNWGDERASVVINGEERQVKTHGKTPDGQFAIPGSTTRGMIRNVLEIASFGKMSLVDDARFGVRDLQPSARLDYGNRVSQERKDGAFEPKSRAGWLKIGQDGEIIVTACDFARIEHRDLSVKDKSLGFQGRAHKHADQANAKVIEWLFTHPEGEKTKSPIGLTYQFRIEKASSNHKHGLKRKSDKDKPNLPDSAYKYLHYKKAMFQKDGSSCEDGYVEKSGTLVFTGMPSTSKHMEFVFFDRREQVPFFAPKLEGGTTDEGYVWRSFLDVHERQEKVSPTWEWRKKQLAEGDEIPVFYLTNKSNEITHLGLAMMFKMAADHSVHQMIGHTSPDHTKREPIDLAEAIFGRLEGAKGAGDGWRGRVSFGWAFADEETVTENEEEKCAVILAKPKPSFAPAYVRQKDFQSITGNELLTVETKTDRDGNPKAIKANYRSYMNWDKDPKDEIRGWKRYPVGAERNIPPQNHPPTGDGVSYLRPLRPKAADKPMTFTMTLRYHNLHPIELGALLWAITWGGDETLRHAMGMGRPLGFGQTKMQADLDEAQNTALQAYIGAMENWAKNKAGLASGWAKSVQIGQLKAMADPKVGATAKLDYLKLNVPGDNFFAKAKTAGSILPEYGGLTLEGLGSGKMSKNPKKPDQRGGGGNQGGNNQNYGRPQQPNKAAQSSGRLAMYDGQQVTVLREKGNKYEIRYEDGDFEDVPQSAVTFL